MHCIRCSSGWRVWQSLNIAATKRSRLARHLASHVSLLSFGTHGHFQGGCVSQDTKRSRIGIPMVPGLVHHWSAVYQMPWQLFARSRSTSELSFSGQCFHQLVCCLTASALLGGRFDLVVEVMVLADKRYAAKWPSSPLGVWE